MNGGDTHVHLREEDSGNVIVDVKHGVIWDGTHEVRCSRDLSQKCSLFCPLVCYCDDEVTFYCGGESVTYGCEVVK
jgi:hypothetical protein